MKKIAILLEYINENYDILAEVYGQKVIDTIKADFKKQMEDNPGVPGFSDPITKKPFTDAQLDQFISAFDKLRSNLPSPQNDIYNYTTLKDEFELDDFFSLLANKDKTTTEKEKELEIPDLIYSSEDGNIKLFNGNREDLCTRFKGEVPWCITKGSWAGYRYSSRNGYPTFYLVKNSNLPDDNALSFVAIQSRANDNWVYTNRKNSPYESRVMTFDELLREVPWLSEIPNVKSKMPWVDITDTEREEQEYKNTPVSYSTWNLYFTPTQKLRYFNIRSTGNNPVKLFDDMSQEKFVSDYLPKLDKNLKESIIRNQLVEMKYLVDNYDNPNFTDSDKKLILKFYLQEGRLSIKQAEELLAKTTVPFELKKDIVNNDKITKNDDRRFFVSSNGNDIIELMFENRFQDVAIRVFKLKPNGTTVSKVFDKVSSTIASKYLSVYPDIDTLPFSVILKLVSSDAATPDLIKKVIDKAKTDEESALLAKQLEDGSTLLIDTNAFTAYKIVNNKVTSLPFSSEEVQNSLTDAGENEKITNNILSVFTNETGNIPSNISKDALLTLVNSIPPQNRVVTLSGTPYILKPAADDNDNKLFTLIPTLKDGVTAFRIWVNRNDEYWRRASYDTSILTPEYCQLIFNYLRSQNMTYTNRDLMGIFGSNIGRSPRSFKNFIDNNPPLDNANTLRPIIYEDSPYLLNTQNPRESYRLGTTGRVLNKSFSPREVAAITGQPVPAATRRGRQPGAAAAAATPPAAAGQVNDAVRQAIDAAGLTTGFNALPTPLKNRILSGTVVDNDSGATSRNRALGDRGRVMRIISAGQSKMYLIRLSASGTMIAQASFQPEARHFIITSNTAFNMGRVGNFINALDARNLRENEKNILKRIALGAATKEELEEIKLKNIKNENQ
jgi:hypothetical protein